MSTPPRVTNLQPTPPPLFPPSIAELEAAWPQLKRWMDPDDGITSVFGFRVDQATRVNGTTTHTLRPACVKLLRFASVLIPLDNNHPATHTNKKICSVKLTVLQENEQQWLQRCGEKHRGALAVFKRYGGVVPRDDYLHSWHGYFGPEGLLPLTLATILGRYAMGDEAYNASFAMDAEQLRAWAALGDNIPWNLTFRIYTPVQTAFRRNCMQQAD